MPKNKNAMTRFKLLDELLSNRYHNYSLDDLTEEVSKQLIELDPTTDGVVRRTIEKDIHYLEEEGPFLVDLERYTVNSYDVNRQKEIKKKCIRYKSAGFSIFKKNMTSDEKYLLSEALSMLGQFEGLPNLDALEGLRLGLGIRKNSNKIVSFTQNPLAKSSLFGRLFTAISQKQTISLTYNKFNNTGSALTLNIYPYLLKEYNRRWFLYGADEKDNKILCFALDRIIDFTSLPSHTYIEYEGNITNIFDDIIGVTSYADSPIYNIVFWVSDVSKDYVRTKPLHRTQEILCKQISDKLRIKYPQLEGGQFYNINCKYNYELIRELTSFGSDLIVLEPNQILEKIRYKLNGMMDYYKAIFDELEFK